MASLCLFDWWASLVLFPTVSVSATILYSFDMKRKGGAIARTFLMFSRDREPCLTWRTFWSVRRTQPSHRSLEQDRDGSGLRVEWWHWNKTGRWKRSQRLIKLDGICHLSKIYLIVLNPNTLKIDKTLQLENFFFSRSDTRLNLTEANNNFKTTKRRALH